MNLNFLTPVVTAFDSEGNIDCQANKNIYDYLIKNGIDGIIIMGSTGEFFSMPLKQRKELIKLAVGYINKRVPVFVGTGCMSLSETIELSNYAYDMGADAVMVVGPYYFNLSKESIELYYDKVAEGTKAKIYLYNFPARTGYDVTPDIVLNLLNKHKNIVGYKDTVSEMGHTRKLINAVLKKYPDFKVYSGFDENLAHIALCGGCGCIGGLSNVVPDLCSSWVKAIKAKDFDKISQLQKTMDGLMALYDIGTPFIPIVKKAMKIRGVDIQDYCTEPFIQANDEQTAKIKKILKDSKLI